MTHWLPLNWQRGQLSDIRGLAVGSEISVWRLFFQLLKSKNYTLYMVCVAAVMGVFLGGMRYEVVCGCQCKIKFTPDIMEKHN